MPKAILEFNLPEENQEFQLAIHGSDLHNVMWQLTQEFLRRKVNKGEHDYKDADEALDAIWKFIWEETEWPKLNELSD